MKGKNREGGIESTTPFQRASIMIAEGLRGAAARAHHVKEPARRALTRDERVRAVRLATYAEVNGELDLAAGLRNLARTAPRARAA